MTDNRGPMERAIVNIGRGLEKLADILPDFGHDVDAPAPVDWHGWAVPAILEVLAEHPYCRIDDFDSGCGCPAIANIDQSRDEWAEHVAPIIADRIGCDLQRAIAALSTYQPDKVTP